MKLATGWTCLVVSAAACQGELTHAAQGTVRDSVGVRLVDLPRVEGSNPALALSLDSSWMRSDTTEFGELLDVESLPDGRVALLDRFGARVLIASPTGEIESQFGGDGNGPGEFNPRGVSRVLVTDSSLFVPDLFQQRISEFRFDGQLLDTQHFPGGGPVYAVDWRTHPAGGVVLRVLDPGGDRVLWMHQGVLDTLYAFAALDDTPNLLLPPVPLWDLGESTLVTATSAVWEVRSMDLRGGAVSWIARRATGRMMLTDADRSALEDVLIASVAKGAGTAEPTGQARAPVLAQVTFPEVRPALAGLHLAKNGDVWVRAATDVTAMGAAALRVGSAAGYGGSEWDVLTKTGLLRGRIRLPDGFTVTQFTDSWLYGISTDQMGVQRPARLALPW